jgi:ATP-grasp ribosomal peptide maturase
MTHPSVLVLTHWYDPTADSVVRALAQRGAEVFRCDAADFPQHLTATGELGRHGWTGTLHTAHRSIDLEKVTGAYYRRPSHWEMPASMSEEERQWAASEAKYGLGGLLSAALPWLNHPAAIARTEYKPVQLHTAARVGLAVPPTILTNDPAAAARFAAQHDGKVIYKTLSGELVTDGGEVKAIFTTPVSGGDHGHPSIAHTAHLFQRQVTDKAYDVRVTAVDDVLFAVAVRSDSAAGHLDWRRDYESLSYEVLDVPADVADAIGVLMWRLELRFGALDFAVTTTGEWLFYEINPNGQWGWVEDATGLPIADAIADALITTGETH